MTFKKIIGKLHLWLGLASGIVVFILGVTGCLYAFIEEIEPIVYKHQLFIEPQSTPKKPLSEIWQAAQTVVGKEHLLMGASIPNTPGKTCSFTIYKAKENSNAIWYWQDIELYRTVYINPYTAQVVANTDKRFEFFEFVVNLHWSLLLTNEIGQPLVGTATLIFVISLITGLLLWWPKNKAAAKQRFWFKWKDTTRWKRKNYDLHNIPGFYIFFIALIFGLTGLVWTFDWFDESVQWIANGGVHHEHDQPMKSDTTKYASGKTSLDQLFAKVQSEYPAAERYFVSVPADSSGVISIFISHSRFDYYSNEYDQYTGKLLKSETFADENNGHKLRSMNYDIHTGGIAGLPGKILAFIGSLICASLPVTGFYIWWGRRKREKKTAADYRKNVA